MVAEKTPEYLTQLFRVKHEKSGDVVAGFDTLQAATEDATARNERAKAMGIKARYKAWKRP